MANVTFAYGTTTPTTSTSGFDDGCLYFNTASRKIYFRKGSVVYTFDGNDTTYSNYISTEALRLSSNSATITNSGSLTVDNMTSSRITINGIFTGWSHSGSGTNPKVYSKTYSYTSSGATTTVTFACSFSGAGTATFTYWYIPN